MAHTNSTSNLELSQFIGTDKPDWLTDYNGDMAKLDNSYGAVAASAAAATAASDAAAASAAQAASDAAQAVSDVSGAVTAAQAATAAATEATQTAASASSTATAAQSVASTAAGDAASALSVAQNAKTTAESAQAAAAQAATDAAASAATVQTYADIVPATASSSNKLATMADVGGSGDQIFADPWGDFRVAQESGEALSAMLTRFIAGLDYSKITKDTKIKIKEFGGYEYVLSVARLRINTANNTNMVSFIGYYNDATSSSYYFYGYLQFHFTYNTSDQAFTLASARQVGANASTDITNLTTYTEIAIEY